ncbi:MAG: hypothetical protein M1831_007393 [Alyxoria varia]|nr:MAG: hypothetical protein M1831_007393 [Alyxoria varia]
MSEQQQTETVSRPPQPTTYVPTRKPETDFPLIDNDPHAFRVVKYARTSDYWAGAALAALPSVLNLYWERISPAGAGKGAFSSIMRLNVAIGLVGGFVFGYQRSILRFYGVTENSREVEMDMREMVDKVKKGEPLYGKSELSDYMQGVAARNSRYTGIWLHLVPMFNLVNHNQHGVDTAKYYQQAERELEAERLAKQAEWKDG